MIRCEIKKKIRKKELTLVASRLIQTFSDRSVCTVHAHHWAAADRTGGQPRTTNTLRKTATKSKKASLSEGEGKTATNISET